MCTLLVADYIHAVSLEISVLVGARNGKAVYLGRL